MPETARVRISCLKTKKHHKKEIMNIFSILTSGARRGSSTYNRCYEYREKKRRKCHFDLSESVHETEYTNVKRPVDPSTKKPIEPAHKFEVTTEPDSFTQEK